MRVSVDARALELPGFREQGIGRYAKGLLGPLAEVAEEHDAELIQLRGKLRRPRVDVHHALSLHGARLRPGGAMIVTMHDVAPLQWPEDHLRTGLRHRLLYRAVKRAAAVICPSHAAAGDVTEHLGLDPGRVTVIGEAADEPFAPVERRLDLPTPYVLYVGSLQDPRKDVASLVASWQVSGVRRETLVLAGSGRAPEGDRVLSLGFVPDEDLPALYSGAACLVTASRYEGFGLPALEALACGTPVVAYDAGAIPETAGPGALLAPAGDAAALMAAVGRVCDEPELRAKLSDAGRRHAAGFSWRAAAEATWEVYESVATLPRP